MKTLGNSADFLRLGTIPPNSFRQPLLRRRAKTGMSLLLGLVDAHRRTVEGTTSDKDYIMPLPIPRSLILVAGDTIEKSSFFEKILLLSLHKSLHKANNVLRKNKITLLNGQFEDVGECSRVPE